MSWNLYCFSKIWISVGEHRLVSYRFPQRSGLDFVSRSEFGMKHFPLFLFFSFKVDSNPRSPFFTYQPPREKKKSRHCGWINKDVLCSLQWDSYLKYLYYHVARLSKEARVKSGLRFPKGIVKKWQRNGEKRRHVKMFCHVCSSSPVKLCLKCHPPLRCQAKPDPRELLALTDFSGRLVFQVWDIFFLAPVNSLT